MTDIKPELDKIIDSFWEELSAIRTGRANPALVENIPVDYYGSKAPLKQVASISVPGPREILIQPWNKDNLIDIEKALSQSSLNLSSVNTGEAIRINLPPLTEESRRELVKMLKAKMEESRKKIREIRDGERKKIIDTERDKEISEDEKFRQLENLDKTTEEYNHKMEEMGEKKEREIMTV